MGQPQPPSPEELLAKVRQLREKIGQGLASFIMKKHADGAEPESLGQEALSTIVQEFTDIGKGIDRLRKAATGVGDARYSEICRELDLASESIDDIPDRDALQRLLTRVESETTRRNGNTRGPSKGSIGDARGRLLQAARKLAEKSGKRLVDIIAEASEGKLSLEGLRDLTDADVALVSATTARMV
jgi:hypothetical protein